VALAEGALAVVDEVVFVLPRQFPHKTYSGASFEQRVELLGLALGGEGRYSVAASERGLFAEIAGECRQAYGADVRLSFLCGRDAAERIANWDYGRRGAFQDMLQQFDLLVAARDGEYYPPESLVSSFARLELSGVWDHVSASQVRTRISRGEPWEHLVPAAVRRRVGEIYGVGGKRVAGPGLPGIRSACGVLSAAAHPRRPPHRCYSRNVAFSRVIWIVLDSVGIGEMPDAADWGDAGSDTLGNIARVRGIHLPNLASLGLGNIMPLSGIAPAAAPAGAYGKCTLASPGKDTTTGHWEMAGIHLAKPFPLYPHGFPPDVMSEFERRIGRRSLGNKAASGTEIIKELGVEHMRTGSPIVYTSADSVFQIAAHEEVIPLRELYKMCETARAILRGPHEVGRVIARPFVGAPGSFTRTSNRHDYAVAPPAGMLLDQLHDRGVAVHGVGKIFDIFLGRGVQDSTKTRNNTEGMAQTLEAMRETDRGLIFVNLVDFDQNYGHRNDVEGYGAALEQFDAWLPEFEGRMGEGDLAILTADHGCDPTTPSTDHSREYVPLLAFGPKVRPGVNLGVRGTLSDIGQTVAENFGARLAQGQSFLKEILD